MRPSTGRTGSCFDNAVTESFFSSLETEFIDHTTFRMRRHAEQAVFAYSEGFYNPRRRHSANGHLSPAEYERRHAAGTPNVPSSRPNTGLPANGGTAAGPCKGRAGHRAGGPSPARRMPGRGRVRALRIRASANSPIRHTAHSASAKKRPCNSGKSRLSGA
ncbi:IS3 family transposase [Streptomyces smyrnaeus]|uniref:IS3 family transposase n=1 Tax=Streptomyces smyrnaeus TaxID=1387713 RepID=UPI0036ED076F